MCVCSPIFRFSLLVSFHSPNTIIRVLLSIPFLSCSLYDYLKALLSLIDVSSIPQTRSVVVTPPSIMTETDTRVSLEVAGIIAECHQLIKALRMCSHYPPFTFKLSTNRNVPICIILVSMEDLQCSVFALVSMQE